MAKRVATLYEAVQIMDATPLGTVPPKYPWDLWSDGSRWEVTQAEVGVSWKVFRDSISTFCKPRGATYIAQVSEDGTRLRFQIFPSPAEITRFKGHRTSKKYPLAV